MINEQNFVKFDQGILVEAVGILNKFSEIYIRDIHVNDISIGEANVANGQVSKEMELVTVCDTFWHLWVSLFDFPFRYELLR